MFGVLVFPCSPCPNHIFEGGLVIFTILSSLGQIFQRKISFYIVQGIVTLTHPISVYRFSYLNKTNVLPLAAVHTYELCVKECSTSKYPPQTPPSPPPPPPASSPSSPSSLGYTDTSCKHEAHPSKD